MHDCDPVVLVHTAAYLCWQNLHCTHIALEQCICHWYNHSYKRAHNPCRFACSRRSKFVRFLQAIAWKRVNHLSSEYSFEKIFFIYQAPTFLCLVQNGISVEEWIKDSITDKTNIIFTSSITKIFLTDSCCVSLLTN